MLVKGFLCGFTSRVSLMPAARKESDAKSGIVWVLEFSRLIMWLCFTIMMWFGTPLFKEACFLWNRSCLLLSEATTFSLPPSFSLHMLFLVRVFYGMVSKFTF